MSDELGHERRRDGIAAYLLEALSPGEAAELERHLAGCSDCRAYERRLRPAVALLAESVERLDPPRRLRSEILEQVRAGAGSDPALAASEVGRQMPFSRRRWFVSWRPAAGLAAVALVAAVVAGYAIRGGDSNGGGARMVAMTGEAPGMTAQLTRDGSSGTLELANVHPLPSGMVLEAWVRRDGDVSVAGGLFVPDRDGHAMATIPDMRRVESVMVTEEPRGGSEYPTSAPMLTLAMG